MANPSAATLSTTLPTGARPFTNFANFQFKTIGQPPDLLKRMSGIDADIPEYENSDAGSMSPEPDLIHELLPSEGYEESPDGPKQPSLRERLALQEEETIDDSSSSSDSISKTRPSNIIDWNAGRSLPVARPSAHTNAVEQGLNIHANPIAGSSAASSSNQQRRTSSDTMGPIPYDQIQSPSSMEVDNDLRPKHSSQASLTDHETSIPPTFAALQDLKAQLAASLATLNPIATQEALSIANSAKESCAEVHTSANRAYELSCKALASAEESMTAAKECLVLAETVQRKTSEVLNAVASIGDTGKASSWNDTLQKLSSGLHELERWGTEMEVQRTRELDHIQAEQRSQANATQYPLSPSSNNSNSMTSSPLPPIITDRTSAAMFMSVEHEADAAVRAWNQIREQEAERRRLAAEDLRKARENEERAQRQKDEANAAHAVATAERIEAEEKEKERQRKEDEEAELRRQEVARKKAEAARLRQISEERTLKAAEANEKTHLDARLEEQGQKQRETQRRLEAEKTEALQKELLREQETKRQEIANQKQRANADHARKIQSDRAKLKQPLQTSGNNLNTLLPQSAIQPVTPATPPSKAHHVQLLSQKSDVAIALARVPSNEALNRGQNLENHTSRDDSNTDSLLSGIVASATLSSVTASSSEFLDLSARRLHVLTGAGTVGVNGHIHNPAQLMHPMHNVGFTRASSTSSVQNNGDGKPAHQLSTHLRSTSIERTSKVPSASRGALPSVQTNTSVHKTGASHDNIAFIPLSQISSTASVPQQDNSTIKVEPEDDKPLAAAISSQLSAPFVVSARSEIILPKDQSGDEPVNDIPLLSLPSPVVRQISSNETRLPIGKPVEGSERHSLRGAKGHGKKGSTGHGSGVQVSKQAAVPTTNVNQPSNGHNITVNTEGRPQSNGLNVASLPPRPQTSLDFRGRTPVRNDVESPTANLSSRMGPDAVVADGRTKTTSSEETMHVDQRRSRPRSPVRQTGRINDHYSPSSTTATHGKQRGRQPPRGDHYSPPRSPPRRLQSPKTPSRSHSRDSDYMKVTLSPGYELYGYEHQSLPTKRKRSHLVDQTNGPPHRRARYDNQSLYDAESSRNDVHNWSNVADYSRSPTPEMPRSTPLQMRIEDSDRRPQHQASNYYRNNQGTNKQRPDFRNNRLPPRQSSPREPHYESGNLARQNPRHSNDSRQPLINRFGEQPSVTNSNYHTPSGRGSRGRGRGGAHHSTGNRNKGTLIDRLD